MYDSLNSVLEKAGYKNQERTLFIWEGVSYYLDREAARETLGFVSRSHRDSVIAFDFEVSLSEENRKAYYGADELMKSMKEHHENEQLLFSIKDGELESFLADMNLRVMAYLDHVAIEQKYLLDEASASIGRMTEVFRFACASPIQE